MKYIELVKGLFTAEHEVRAKHLEPYVAYSTEANRFMFNFISEHTEGQADNEIWYTTTDDTIIMPSHLRAFGVNIVKIDYNDDRGVIIFDGPVMSIGDQAFSNCSSLSSVTIPNSVASIGNDTFLNCTSLTTIIFEGTIVEWNKISKGVDWNYNTPTTHVQCLDGSVTL